MAGHSQFKNIMHRKGAQDKKRAKEFTRLIKEIQVAAKQSVDPSANPRLRPQLPPRVPQACPRTTSNAFSKRRKAAVTTQTTKRFATKDTVPAVLR